MSRYVLSPRAKADIEEIWDYTSVRWGVEQAEAYIRQLQAGIEAATADPDIGRPCDEIKAGYRKHRVGSHVIFFRAVRNGIDIVRVLHARMDFERHI